jgi:hypothetical protein
LRVPSGLSVNPTPSSAWFGFYPSHATKTRLDFGGHSRLEFCVRSKPEKIQLSRAEEAFRISKSDLRLRPVFHHKTERVEAHILVCFLTLALWRTLEMWMRGRSQRRPLRPNGRDCSSGGPIPWRPTRLKVGRFGASSSPAHGCNEQPRR